MATRTVPLTLALSTLILFAGCIASEEETDPADLEIEPAAKTQTLWQNETFSGTLIPPNPLLFNPAGGCEVVFTGVEDVHHAWHTINAPADGTKAQLELAWTHAGPSAAVVYNIPDMDLLVYDAAGNVVAGQDDNPCAAASSENPEIFEAILPTAGEYRLLVVNFAAVAADYTLDVVLSHTVEETMVALEQAVEA